MTYGLVMIVKNERDTIARCLASVRPHISHWTVLDTGSTDGTQDIIREELDGIPGQLIERPFVDFGTTRSVAFAAARGTADWLLAMDADFTVEIDPDFEPDPTVDAYNLTLGDANFRYRLPLLLNGHRSWKSVGAVHEMTLLQDGTLGRRESTDKVRVTDHGGNRFSLDKVRWQAGLLEAELEREPDNPRTVFYLAQSYRLLSDPRALDLYRRRRLMGGWDEEAFYAAFRAATLEPLWPTRAAALLAAWEMRPHRLEPLHALIEELNQRGQHRAAYALVSGAYRLKTPSSKPTAPMTNSTARTARTTPRARKPDRTATATLGLTRTVLQTGSPASSLQDSAGHRKAALQQPSDPLYTGLSIPESPADTLFVHRSVWDWGMDFERSIAAWWVGEPEESRALGEALLERAIPDHVRAAVLRNLSFVRAA